MREFTYGLVWRTRGRGTAAHPAGGNDIISVERQIEQTESSIRYKPVFAQANVTNARTRIKWRSAARLSGDPISMHLTEVAMTRTSIHAASGNGALHGNDCLDGGNKLAANNVDWRIAA
jgi:hypothetical protein